MSLPSHFVGVVNVQIVKSDSRKIRISIAMNDEDIENWKLNESSFEVFLAFDSVKVETFILINFYNSTTVRSRLNNNV